MQEWVGESVFMNKVNTRRKVVSAAVLGKRSWVRMMGLGIPKCGLLRLTPQILSAHRDFHSQAPLSSVGHLFSVVWPCFLRHRWIDHRCMSIFLGLLSCSVHLYFCFCAVPCCFFPGGTAVKNSPADAGDARDVGSVPELGRSSEVGNGNPSSILVWKIPWTEEPGGLWSMGLWTVGHN